MSVDDALLNQLPSQAISYNEEVTLAVALGRL